jgi:hypothetical protein
MPLALCQRPDIMTLLNVAHSQYVALIENLQITENAAKFISGRIFLT